MFGVLTGVDISKVRSDELTIIYKHNFIFPICTSKHKTTSHT